MKFALPCLVLCFVGGSLAIDVPFNYTSGSFTILEKLTVNLSVPYTDKHNKTKTVDVPFEDVLVDDAGSSANETNAVLKLTFGIMNTNSLVQTFAVNKQNTKFAMVKMEVSITFDDKLFPDPSRVNQTFEFNTTDSGFEADINYSYACDANVTMISPDNCMIQFSDVMVQPFKVENKKFSAAQHCSQDLGPSTETMTTSQTIMTTSMGTHNMTSPIFFTTEIVTELMTTAEPPPQDAKFNYTTNGKTCILEEITAIFILNYTTKQKTIKKYEFKLPGYAAINKSLSHCGNKSKSSMPAVLTVDWDNGNSFQQVFGVDGSYFYLKYVTLVLNVSNIPDIKDPKLYKFNSIMPNNKTFRTPLGDSLACNSTQNTTFTKDGIILSFSNVRLQPFSIPKSNGYSGKYVCAADNAISNIVPIIVGCALAVLVIIVLIAYLIGRRNSSKHGYESV